MKSLRSGIPPVGRLVASFGICLMITGGVLGCKDLAGTPPLPAGTISPGNVQNAAGAVQTAVAAEYNFQQAYADFVTQSGVLTDELQSPDRDFAIYDGAPFSGDYYRVVVDARLLDQTADWQGPGDKTDPVYQELQTTRGLAYQAIGGLGAYAPDSLVLRGRMYAFLGYAEVMLADLFCSGVPLSTLDFQGDWTYKPGATTTEIYQQAIALFDTAQTLAANNTQIVNLAKIGQGRSYAALGQYASAGQAVKTVPPTFRFVDSLLTCGDYNNPCSDASYGYAAEFQLAFYASVSDREAGTGLPFISSGDPRTTTTVLGGDDAVFLDFPTYFPTKYNVSGISALVVASGLEGQLITAEADLNAGDAAGMFTILNALRQGNATTSSMPTLTDPGTFGAEVDTLFTERAAWLFADGHRQGDLRRLVRNYVNGQGIQVVANQYPSGDYGYGVGLYGSFIDAPVPVQELSNPLFTGCLSRD